MKRFTSFTLFAVFFFCSLSLNAVDFGLVFYQNAEVNVPAFDFEEKSFDISGVLYPWFSAPLGGDAYLYISAAINYETDPMVIIPELTKADISFILGNANINVGRMFYSDPLGFTACGLFDGVQGSFITRNGNIHAGWLYTGFLYKERAAITMTHNERQSVNTKLDYSDFVNTYFAPARILMTLEYDHPAIGEFIGLKTSIICQFDSGRNKLNSQYFTSVISFFGKFLILDMGGCFELIEYNDKTTPAYATNIGLTFILPTKLEKQIKLLGRYSSGVSENESIGAFLPITTVPQGELVEAKLSALSLLSLDYTGRMAKSLSANMAFTYFIRTDLGTYTYYPVTRTDKEGFFLGAEIFGRLIWNISSGIRLNFGTGVFLPALGNAAPDADMLWRAKLNLIFSIY